jgi:carbonic anhydrase
MKQYCAIVLILLISLSNFYATDSKKNHKKRNLSLSRSKLLSTAFSQAKAMKPTNGKPAHKHVYNPDLLLQPKEKLDTVLTGWLKISSPNFKNPHKFPPLQLPNGSEIKININDAYFRINDTFTPGDKNGPQSNLDFWFRLSGRNLYYSINQSDINVLGSIAVRSVRDAEPMKGYSDEPTCFKIDDEESSNWKICAKDVQTKADWVCKIKKALGTAGRDCTIITLAESEVTVLTKKVTQPIILIPQPSKTCNENWDYSRKGEDWECTCAEGKEQSPLDLPLAQKATKSPTKPLFQYDEVSTINMVSTEDGRTKNENLKIKFVNGSLKISFSNFGKVVTLDGSVYEAEDIIFHTPSEHTINGKKYPLEIQIIHNGKTKGDIAKQVVLSFLFESKPGVYNKFIDDVDFFNLPNPSNKERDIINSLYIPKILYSSDNDDLPIMKPFSFYTYQGSLTQPPCSERTIHYVASNPIPLGTTALTLIQEASRIPDIMDSNGNVIVNTLGPQNSRSTQQLNGRAVFHYDHTEFCGPDAPTRPKDKISTSTSGHYEKVVKKNTEYFFVNGSRPSGLPGTFVVSEMEAKGLSN